MDTLVDPVESLSSSRMLAAAPVTVTGPRASFQSVDPEAQVQWFERVITPAEGVFAAEEEPSTVDVEVLWDEESDGEPTLVLRRRAVS